MTLTTIAVCKAKKTTGMTNVKAKIDFAKNVAIVAPQICLAVWTFSDSSDMWIPNASENASAIAMVSTPPNTASFEPVPEFNPTINPNVVMTADVKPKEMPVLNDSFIALPSNATGFVGPLRITHIIQLVAWHVVQHTPWLVGR